MLSSKIRALLNHGKVQLGLKGIVGYNVSKEQLTVKDAKFGHGEVVTKEEVSILILRMTVEKNHYTGQTRAALGISASRAPEYSTVYQISR